MKAFFSKIWTWILANKMIAIVVASVLVVGTTCAIVLPIALHEHSYATEWSSDAETHWHSATCKHEEEKSDLAAHTYTNACDTTCDVCGYTRTVGAHVYDNACDTSCNVCGATRTITHDYAETLTEGETTHWYACSVCGDKKDETAHVFDKTVAHSDYLKAAATATTKAQYYKSCVCGAKSATEYFETDKTTGTLANIQDLSKTYDKVELANPTYETNSDGAVTIEWYQGDTKLGAKPVNAGTYKVKVIIAESATYAGVSAEKEFTIAKKVLTNISFANTIYKGSTNFSFVLSAVEGLVSGESFMLQVTTASKNVGNAVEIASISYANNNYSIDKSAITLNIVPKTINVTAEFEYSGISVRQIHAPAPSLSDVIDGDEVYIEITFDKADVYATVLTGEDAPYLDGADCDNYTLGTYSFSIVPKKLTLKAGEKIEVTETYNTLKQHALSVSSNMFDGYVDTDAATLWLTATLPSKNAGKYTEGVVLTPYVGNTAVVGTVSHNYDFSEVAATVTVKPLTVSLSSYVKVEYNGTSEFTLATPFDLTSANTGGGQDSVSDRDEVYITWIETSDADITDETFAIDYTLGGADACNYDIDELGVEITKKKLTNLHLYITSDTYESGEITLIAKDGVVAGEVVKISITNVNDQDFWEGFSIFMQLTDGTAPDAYRYETIALIASGDYANYELATYDDGSGYQVVGIVEGVANCDVQYDGSCNCGTSHLTETLTFTGGEDVGKSATIDCDFTYEGGIYKIALEGGKYEFLGSDQFFNISGIYDVNGNKLASSIGTYILPQGTYYFHVYVGSSPSSDTIWVKKTAKILDAATMANAIVPDMEPGNSDAGVRIHNLQTHNGGDTFVLFYNVGENINALGQSINFRYEDGDEGYSATSNIESIEFYDVNGIQLNVTYDEPDMLAASGVTAVGGVYIVVTMDGEGMDNLYFYAV